MPTLVPSAHKGARRTPIVKLGGSIVSSHPYTLRRDSRARTSLTLGDFVPTINQQSTTTRVPSAVAPATCVPTPTAPRTNLINMKCRYFHSFTGCKRPDCRFLHNETPQDVVFHDGTETPRNRRPTYIAPGPRVDVKIFVGNLPPGTVSSFVVDMASPFGEVTHCDVLRSNLRNGRCPAILFMSSDAQADAAINAINAYIDERGQRAYARKEFSYPVACGEASRPERLKYHMAATKAVTAEIKTLTEFAATPPTAPPTTNVSMPKRLKPTLVTDNDGFSLLKTAKTVKIRNSKEVLELSTTFAPLVDLAEDVECEESDDCETTELSQLVEANTTPPFELKQMPALNSIDSPVTVIMGDWARRNDGVMSPFPMAMPPTTISDCLHGDWHVLMPSPLYSDC